MKLILSLGMQVLISEFSILIVKYRLSILLDYRNSAKLCVKVGSITPKASFKRNSFAKKVRA